MLALGDLRVRVQSTKLMTLSSVPSCSARMKSSGSGASEPGTGDTPSGYTARWERSTFSVASLPQNITPPSSTLLLMEPVKVTMKLPGYSYTAVTVSGHCQSIRQRSPTVVAVLGAG